jgi:hypothetical protein
MAEYKDREHYIPLRKSDLAELLIKDKQVRLEERGPLRQFFRLVGAVFHFEYQQQLEELKNAYAPFDPDAETLTLAPPPPEERAARMAEVFDKFTALMERANFKHLSRAEIQQFIDEVPTDWGLDTSVDLSAFERLEVFARGDVVGERSRRVWRRLWRKETIKLPVFSRLVMLLKIKKGAIKDKDINTDAVFLKVFKDVPKADLEMLLPGARPRLTRLDRALIAYPLIAGVGLILFNIFMSVFKKGYGVDTLIDELIGGLGAALVTWSAAVAIGGYGYKSYFSWQVKKQSYNFRLTRSLYYQTLDSNTGVLMRLLDEAEEQECRETFLAYFCLWKYAPAEGWTQEMLDDYVENYLEGAVVVKGKPLKVDFEIGDALAKLERLGLVKKTEAADAGLVPLSARRAAEFGLPEVPGRDWAPPLQLTSQQPEEGRPVKKEGPRYRAVALDKALEMLDWRWDNYFKYANPEPEEPPAV